jgi:serine/threonine protein kinase
MSQEHTQPFPHEDRNKPSQPADAFENDARSTQPSAAAADTRSLRIDGLCNRFETSLQEGEGPRIEDFLTQVEAGEREELLYELLAVEIWHRRATGQEPALEDYLHRFPAADTAVRRVFVRGTSPNASAAQTEERVFATGDDRAAEAYALSLARGSDTNDLTGGLGRLGEYELLAKLGEGGMGAVYKARQTRLGKIVALKVLPKDRTGDPQAVARFEREMKAIGGLSHPNIVQAYDARDIEGTTVLVMEYVEGLDLAQVVQRHGALPIAEACELVRQAAAGLQHAHEHNMVHRDIKPSNLMLAISRHSSAIGGQPTAGDRQPQADRGSLTACVKILDLGLALLASEKSSRGELTSSGAAMGTADYIAPEQATDSHNVDIRADIYSLGCTLYKFLTGRAPFSGPQYQSTMQKMLAHAQTPPPAANVLRPDIPDELAAVLERMMAKNPDGRFQVPAEVVEAVAPLCSGANLAGLFTPDDLPTCSMAVAPPTPPRRRSRGSWWLPRRRIFVAAALGLAILATAAVAWNLLHPLKLPEVAVQQAVLFVRRNGDDNNIEKLTLTDRHDENELVLRPLGPNDDFKLRVEFNRPTYWCLVWLDTKGTAQIAARSERVEKVLEYPPGNRLVSVDPHDPVGTHMLLLLASERPASEFADNLEHCLTGIGPPKVVPGKAAPIGITRGAGSVQTTTADLDSAYFQQVERQLPNTVRWVHQLYLPTQP